MTSGLVLCCVVGAQPIDSLSQAEATQLLACFVEGMKAEIVEIQRVCTQGLYHTLRFATENFKDENVAQRDSIVSAMYTATNAADMKVRAFGSALEVAGV